MNPYLTLFRDTFVGYAHYVLGLAIQPHWENWLYCFLILSFAVYGLELLFPWRRLQSVIRRDFWLDGFYMVFNLFLLGLLGFEAVVTVVEQLFVDARTALGLTSLEVLSVATWPIWLQLVVLFFARDFVHYWIHRLLHAVPVLWRFHKVHHSVREMGFAAHLRYHWMESVVYRSLEYLPLGLIGFGIQEFFIVYMAGLAIGHLNHANVWLPLGPFRYILNSSRMHIWHHARDVPSARGVNFGLSLSCWDWLFRTAHWPHSGRDEELGFDGLEEYPTKFFGHMVRPFRERS